MMYPQSNDGYRGRGVDCGGVHNLKAACALRPCGVTGSRFELR